MNAVFDQKLSFHPAATSTGGTMSMSQETRTFLCLTGHTLALTSCEGSSKSSLSLGQVNLKGSKNKSKIFTEFEEDIFYNSLVGGSQMYRVLDFQYF